MVVKSLNIVPTSFAGLHNMVWTSVDNLLTICKNNLTYAELDIVISYLERQGKDKEVCFRIHKNILHNIPEVNKKTRTLSLSIFCGLK
jgi:hypothetical protein